MFLNIKGETCIFLGCPEKCPGKKALRKITPQKYAPRKIALRKIATWKNAPIKIAPRTNAPRKIVLLAFCCF